jgi:prophage regulatory protein
MKAIELASSANNESRADFETEPTQVLAIDTSLRSVRSGAGKFDVLVEHRDMPNNSNPPGALPETGYVRESQLVPAIFPFSSATVWRKVKAGTFPQPVKLSSRITAWRVDDIRTLIERQGR